MNAKGFWYHYGLARLRSYFKLLKDFEPVGFDTLKVHLFLVGDFLALKHLDGKETLGLIKHLKAGDIVIRFNRRYWLPLVITAIQSPYRAPSPKLP
jgi:hypothetical protein